jgi:uncharacterized membrane protein YhaH (DUF805 family)
VCLLAGLLFVSLLPMQIPAEKNPWWDDHWSFRQEILLPIQTNDDLAAFQPVDTFIVFDSPCWARDEQHHSIRVVCQSKESELELESQIYGLIHSDEDHITSCNLVFLVPENVDGTEQYFVYFDESETSPPKYLDHVSIEDSSYFYEPIPGYPLESRYYKISQEGVIIYAVAQEGQFMWYSTSQYVTKLVDGATEMMPKNGEVAASFDFTYYYDEAMSAYYSTSQQLISKEIFCDGNLMVSCGITSQSTDGALQTTAVYTYYYYPTSYKRIRTHVIHEAIKECTIYPASNTDGTYASLQCGGIRSTSIKDLNFGELYPFLHVYTENNDIAEYQVDPNPDYIKDDPVIRLIKTTDDVDVGTKAWASFDEGTTGTVHALVFASNSVVKAGDNEQDGIQLKAYESDYPHLPGLENDVAAFQFTRNAYESGDSQKDMVIPAGFVAEFDAEFFSSSAGGYPLVENEGALFQALATMLPSAGDDRSPEKNNTGDRYALTVYVHDAPSFPLGSALSVLTGRNIPYITTEVYRDEGFACSGSAVRLPLKPLVLTEGSSFRQRCVAAIRILDVHNLSLFKKICFQQLEAGRYLIKVFKENPLIGTERRYIGYAVVDLQEDSTVHVVCAPQGSCLVSVVDQQGTGVAGAEVMLHQDDQVISKNLTDASGFVLLTAPSNREQYELRVLYKGFVVDEEPLHLGLGRILLPLKKTVALERYNWKLNLVDTWGLPCAIELMPHLTSNEMETTIVLTAEQRTPDTFEFFDLLPANYLVTVQYKTFVVEKNIQIPAQDEHLVFPAVFPITLHVKDSRGLGISDVTIQLARGGKTEETSNNASGTVVSLPPGVYMVTVVSHGEVISQRTLNVVGERSVDLITIQEPVFPLLIIVVACVVVMIAFIASMVKKEPLYVLLFLIVCLSSVALVFPWWAVTGSSSGVETSSTLYVAPLELVTTTKTSQVIAGELAFFPDIFMNVMTLLLALVVLECFLVLISLVLKRIHKKRWYFVTLLSALIIMVGSLILFYVAMSTFTEVGVGSFVGKGNIDVSIPGEELSVSVLSQWGPGNGFFIYVVSTLILSSFLLVTLYKNKKKKK